MALLRALAIAAAVIVGAIVGLSAAAIFATTFYARSANAAITLTRPSFVWLISIHFGSVQVAPLPNEPTKPVLFLSEANCRAHIHVVRAAMGRLAMPESKIECRKVEVPK